MFGSNRSREERHVVPPAPPEKPSSNKRGMFSVIGPDIVIAGSVRATAELHIEGRVDGDVDCGSLSQGSESNIFGNVTAESARLAGTVEGIVRAKQLTIERTARIIGDVEYENITIENGGHIDGRLKHMSALHAVRTETGPTPVQTTATIASVMTPAFGQAAG